MTEAGARSIWKSKWLWIGLGVLFLILLTAGTVALVLIAGAAGAGTSARQITWEESYVSGEGRDKIAVLPVEGAITDAPSTNPLLTGPSATPETLRSQLDQAAEDDLTKAVILEVNSPGGGLVASDEMRRAILDFKKETGKPVVVSMQDVAASGGYWISTPADRIVAHPATITGSIGVIFSYLNYGEALNKLGIEEEVIKSGKFKDIGSPTNELTPEERKILKSFIDEGYDQFVEVISKGRDIPEDRVRKIGDGRIYTGLQAKNLGLVDGLGTLDDAARISRDLADLKEAEVVRYEYAPGLFESLRVRLTGGEPEAVKLLRSAGINPGPELRAIYRPGQ